MARPTFEEMRAKLGGSVPPAAAIPEAAEARKVEVEPDPKEKKTPRVSSSRPPAAKAAGKAETKTGKNAKPRAGARPKASAREWFSRPAAERRAQGACMQFRMSKADHIALYVESRERGVSLEYAFVEAVDGLLRGGGSLRKAEGAEGPGSVKMTVYVPSSLPGAVREFCREASSKGNRYLFADVAASAVDAYAGERG